MKVLFVCSGNICRSPMAEGYFRHVTADRGLGHVRVDSAGTLGIFGAPASPEAIEAMAEIGVDIGSHRSRGIDETDLLTADLVVAMARHHLEELAHRYPAGAGERRLVRAFEKSPSPATGAPDLDDPIGEALDVYREQREVLRVCLDQLAIRLRHLP